jgi:hypothetical protein
MDSLRALYAREILRVRGVSVFIACVSLDVDTSIYVYLLVFLVYRMYLACIVCIVDVSVGIGMYRMYADMFDRRSVA